MWHQKHLREIIDTNISYMYKNMDSLVHNIVGLMFVWLSMCFSKNKSIIFCRSLQNPKREKIIGIYICKLGSDIQTLSFSLFNFDE